MDTCKYCLYYRNKFDARDNSCEFNNSRLYVTVKGFMILEFGGAYMEHTREHGRLRAASRMLRAMRCWWKGPLRGRRCREWLATTVM